MSCGTRHRRTESWQVPDSRLRRQAVPAYFHPQDSAAEWAQLASTDVGLVVANIADGPGLVREERWAAAFAGARATGCDVVGYVDTGYLGLTGLRTQRGSTLLGDWLEQILGDVETWYRLYGDQVTGIFLDQVAESDDGASLAKRRQGCVDFRTDLVALNCQLGPKSGIVQALLDRKCPHLTGPGR